MKQFYSRTILKLTMLALFAVAGLSVKAQLNMTRQTFSGTYSPISVATGALRSNTNGDDGSQDGLPIGFTFNYLGTPYTTISVNSNGFASFTALTGVGSTWVNSNLATATAPNIILAPWWDDLLIDTTLLNGRILYQTTGTPGSQVMTIQWTDMPSYTTATQKINFQIKLYEGTNVIEFHYGNILAGAPSTSESASIGIEGGLGGYGNFIDAVTGSSFVSMGYNTAAVEWPTNFYRFTPGAPTPMAGGTYNIGAGQTYTSIDQAVAELNHRGITGPVVLNLTDANYTPDPAGGDNVFPVVFGPIVGTSSTNTITLQPASGTATLTSIGTGGGNISLSAAATTIGTTGEPVIAVSGTSFLNINNLNLVASSNLLDRGLLVINNSAVLGANANAFRGITVQLDRTNTSSIGIEQRAVVTPTAPTGSNNNNFYLDLSITNVYNGLNLFGNATFNDVGCYVGNTNPNGFNSIGSANANDIGNGANLSYGIRASNQNNVQIFQNEIRNITVTGAVTSNGIFVEGATGLAQIYRNKVHDIRNTSTTATNQVNGIRASVATAGTHNIRLFNNFVYNLSSGYTSVATATRQITGIFAQDAGGGATTSSIQVDHNSVSINHSGAPNASSACYANNSAAGPQMFVRNNVFANFTTGQNAAGVAYHTGYFTANVTAIGSAGSVSNNNDFYIPDASAGYVGRGATTNYATLANWQTATTQDAASVTVDPVFVSPTADLHASALGLNSAAQVVAHVTDDIDTEVRSGTPDIGADEFVLFTVDATPQSLVSPLTGACYSAAEPIVIQVRNAGVLPLDFVANPCTVTVNVTGAITSTISVILTDNSLNGGVPLPIGSSVNATVGTLNMTTAGTYIFNASVVCNGDLNSSNDAMLATNRSFLAGTTTAIRSSLCLGDSSLVSLAGNTGASIQWQSSSNGTTWTNIPGATGSSFMAIPTATTWYRAEVCGVLNSTEDTIVVSVPSAPTTTNDTVCGLDTLHLAAAGNGTLNWYAQPSGGSIINTGTTLDTVLSVSTTFYVSNTSGGGTASVGLLNNSAGGGQQTSSNYNTFDVLQACTLIGAYAYPGAAGNVVCELRDNAGNLITTRTVAVTAGDVNNRTFIPLNIPLTPGTGYRLAQGPGSVSMFRSNAGVAYPYTLPGVLSITGSAAGATFYYWFYDWQILTGCASARIPVEAVVNTPPSITAAASADTICEGEISTLTVTSSNAGYSYSWSPSATLSSSTGDSVSAAPIGSISYVVASIDPAGCVNRDTVDIVVNFHPTGTPVVGDSLLCFGDSTTIGVAVTAPLYSDSTIVPILDNNPTGSFGRINVSNFPGVLGPNSIARVCLDATHTWDADVSFTLISPQGTLYDLSSGNGGSGDNYTSTCFEMTAATSITTGTAPFTGSFIPEGAGGFANFAGENPNGQWSLWIVDNAGGDFGQVNWWSIEFVLPTIQFAWSSNPAGFTASTASVNVSPLVRTEYFLTVSDSATGCDTTYSYTVDVLPQLTGGIVAPSVVCNGAAVTLTSNVGGGDGAYTYNWGGLSTNDSLSVVVNSDTTFTLDITDGCGAVVSDTATILLAQPLGVTLAGPATACIGDTLSLTANAVGGDGNYTYVWTPNLGTTATVTDIAGSSGFGGYSVSVTDGCNVSPAVGNLTVTFINQPVAAFTFSGASLSYSFSNTSVDATTYSWDFGDGSTSTSASPSHTYNVDGVYQVCLIASNSCGSDTSCQSITVVSTSKPFGMGVVQLWPNPANNQFNVRVDGLQGNYLLLELFDLAGQRVMRRENTQVGVTMTETMNVDLPAGTYYLRVQDGINNATLRIVLQ